MTPQQNLDLKGNFRTHPFAELLVEIVQAKLSGSLRLSFENRKSVVYFRYGEVVYGVSNSKALRLFNLLLKHKKLNTKLIARYPNFANDLEFSVSLQQDGLLSKEDIDAVVVSQIEAIIIDALSWPAGEWEFSSLARPRSDLVFQIDIHKVLIQYARVLSTQLISERFKSVEETFAATPDFVSSVNLLPHEAYMMTRFEQRALKIGELREMSTLPENGLVQALYVLWLGGYITRRDWNSAFSPTRIEHLKAAKISLVKSATGSVSANVETPKDAVESTAPIAEPAKLPELALSLEEYLERVEKAVTHYDILGVTENALLGEIKQSYLSAAKQFHPDRFHREKGDMMRRIQTAFTQLAHAYETLKTDDSRKTYDYKIRKELEEREKRRAAGKSETATAEDLTAERGLESFEEGLNLLNEEEYAAAATFLARAVHYNPQNALYHAYYGKALSADEKQRHKAEAEMQTAVRLDPKNAKVRLVLVDFFIEYNMLKRAEGELKRFLDLVPDNKEAQKLLNSIAQPV